MTNDNPPRPPDVKHLSASSVPARSTTADLREGHTPALGLTIPGPRDPVSLAQATAELVEHSDTIDTALALRLQAFREGYGEGYSAGYAAGRDDQAAELAKAWAEVARPASKATPYAEIERKRWGPGGRAHFADPRPGDFPGRGTS